MAHQEDDSQPSPEAESYVARITQITQELDWRHLTHPLYGYQILHDPEDDSLYVILDRNAAITRRDQYGHDIGRGVFDTLDSFGQGTLIDGGWQEAHIPIRPGDISTRRLSTYILHVTKAEGVELTMTDVLEEIHHDVQTATISHSMLEQTAERILPLSMEDLKKIENMGYDVRVIDEAHRPTICIILDGRSILIDNLLYQIGPRLVLESLIATIFPDQHIDEGQRGEPIDTLAFTFRRGSDSSMCQVRDMILDSETPVPLFVYKFRLKPDARQPLEMLMTMHELIIHSFQTETTDAFTDDDFDAYTEEGLSSLSYPTLVYLARETMYLPKEEKRAYVSQWFTDRKRQAELRMRKYTSSSRS